MPGMSSGSDRADRLLAAAFRSALLQQGLIVLLIVAVLVAAWMWRDRWMVPRVRVFIGRLVAGPAGSGPAVREPAGRRLLRIGFGLLWLFDGILQAQPNMAAGVPSQVIEPTAGVSPPWVQHVVHLGQVVWTAHPVLAGSATVWIQAGIGLWLLAAPRGTVSRLAGLVSVGWGLTVWVFGEAFGGIFAPGLTWLTGAPGAVLVYVAAGSLIALPDRAWRSPRLGRVTMAGLGLFLAVMAGLQAQPSLGFWQGISNGQPAPLAAMIRSMAQTPQPRFLSSLVAAFGTFTEAHGFAVNLFAVAALALAAGAFLSGRPRVIRLGLVGFTVVCLADWVLIEDLGFLGGLGTDPNSMIPFVLLAAGGYLALTRPVPQPADGAAAAVACPSARPSLIANQVVQAASTEASAARIPNAPA
jgi:hypothetical protein